MISFDNEKCMEDFFIENPGYISAAADRYHGHEEDNPWDIRRQVKLGAYGICDIIAVRSRTTKHEDLRGDSVFCEVHVIELKNTALKHDHISQIARYGQFFKEMYSQSRCSVEFSASLIGLKTFPDSTDMVFLAQSIDWLNCYELTIKAEGVALKQTEGWHKAGTCKDHLLDFCKLFELPNKVMDEDYA